MEQIEDALKNEIDDLVNKRKVLEDANQQMSNQLFEQKIEMRKLDTENSSLKMRCRSHYPTKITD